MFSIPSAIVTFSDTVTNHNNIKNYVSISDESGEIALSEPTYTTQNHTLTVIPERNLRLNATYTLEIKAGLVNSERGQVVQPASFTFVTEPIESEPVDNLIRPTFVYPIAKSNVATNTYVVIKFSEPIIFNPSTISDYVYIDINGISDSKIVASYSYDEATDANALTVKPENKLNFKQNKKAWN